MPMHQTAVVRHIHLSPFKGVPTKLRAFSPSGNIGLILLNGSFGRISSDFGVRASSCAWRRCRKL